MYNKNHDGIQYNFSLKMYKVTLKKYVPGVKYHGCDIENLTCRDKFEFNVLGALKLLPVLNLDLLDLSHERRICPVFQKG